MSNNETRISNERLAATIQRLIGKGNAMVGYMDSPEAIEAGAATSLASWQREAEAAMGLALQALRSTPVEGDHIDAAIRLTKQIEGVFYHDHPGGAVQVRAKVQLILAEALAHPLPNPSPSDGEVSDEPFGYWCECKGADPVLLRKPAYIPPTDALHTTTPLYSRLAIDRVAVALDDVARQFPGAFWHLAKGRLSAGEPLFGFQALFGPDEILAEGEGDSAVSAISAALQSKRGQP